jgi:polynucleotide 5'-hydroxyl-kinase GRC3/NOL9
MAEPIIPDDWRAAGDALVAKEARRRVVLVIGASDTGKTTLTAYLASRLHEAGARTAVIDADLGQSNIGPPGVIGLGILPGPISGLSQVPLAAYFVGSISPVGHLLPTVVGARRMLDRARSLGAEAIVVDTSGLVLNNVGRELKERKVEILAPSHIVALRRGTELEPLLHAWRILRRPALLEVAPSPAAQRRTPEERRAYRSARFRHYFRDHRLVTLELARVALRGTRLGQNRRLPDPIVRGLARVLGMEVYYGETDGDVATLLTASAAPAAARDAVRDALRPTGLSDIVIVPFARLSGLLLGLLDERDGLLGLGLLQNLDLAEGRLQMLTPVREIERVWQVRFGWLRLQPDGTEEEVLRPGVLG